VGPQEKRSWDRTARLCDAFLCVIRNAECYVTGNRNFNAFYHLVNLYFSP
jgi:hypothetical protein